MIWCRRLFILKIIIFLLIICINSQRNPLGGHSYLEKQLLCALDKGPCDVAGRQIKGALPEIIGRNCRSCDQMQIANAKRIARLVQTKYPDIWLALLAKYKAAS